MDFVVTVATRRRAKSADRGRRHREKRHIEGYRPGRRRRQRDSATRRLPDDAREIDRGSGSSSTRPSTNSTDCAEARDRGGGGGGGRHRRTAPVPSDPHSAARRGGIPRHGAFFSKAVVGRDHGRAPASGGNVAWRSSPSRSRRGGALLALILAFGRYRGSISRGQPRHRPRGETAGPISSQCRAQIAGALCGRLAAPSHVRTADSPDRRH